MPQKEDRQASIIKDYNFKDINNYKYFSFDEKESLIKDLEKKNKTINILKKKLQALERKSNTQLVEAENNYHSKLKILEKEVSLNSFQKGKQEGTESGLKQVEVEVNNIIKIIENIIDKQNNILESSEKSVVRLSIAIAEKILDQHLDINSNAIINIIKKAIEHMVNRNKITIIVNKNDLGITQKQQDNILKSFVDINHIDIKTDSRITRGGVIIRTNNEEIDAQISSQLEEVSNIFNQTCNS